MTDLQNESDLANGQRRTRRLGIAGAGRSAGVLSDTAEEIGLTQPVRRRVDPPQLHITAVVPDTSTHALALLHHSSPYQVPDAAALESRCLRTVSYTSQRAVAQPCSPMP